MKLIDLLYFTSQTKIKLSQKISREKIILKNNNPWKMYLKKTELIVSKKHRKRKITTETNLAVIPRIPN